MVELVFVALKRTGIANFSFEQPFGVEVIRAAGYPGVMNWGSVSAPQM